MSRLFTFILAAAAALSLSHAAQAEDYRIRTGDTLRIEVLEDEALNRMVLVAPDGRVSVPMAGGVSAAGRTVEQVQADLTARLAPNFATAPTVYVALEKQEMRLPTATGPAAVDMIDVYVMGEAAKPGKIAVEPGTSVLQLFAEMGGFSKFAATKRIQLRRAGQTTLLNYKAIEAGTSTAGATTLSDGDVIVVPQRKLFE